MTFDIEQRLKQFGKKVTLIHAIETNKQELVKYALHRTFEHKRVNIKTGESGETEWFRLNNDDIENIKRLPNPLYVLDS